MKRILAVLVCVALVAPGCAVRSISVGGYGLAVGHGSRHGAAAGQRVSPAPLIPAEYARQLPVGAKVKVSLKNGNRFSATFMGVEGESIRIQKRTRIPEVPILVPLDLLAELALDQGGLGVGKSIAIGVGIGAGVFFMLLAIAAASWD